MPTTTDEGIIIPVNGDIMNPLAGWFATLGTSANDAIAALRAELEQDPLPDPISGEGASVQAISATSWADLPNAPTLSLTLPQACWVQISHSAWLSSTSGDVLVSSIVSGATTLAENQLQVGGPNTAWGCVLYQSTSPGRNQGFASRVVRLNAGENTFKLRAYLNGGTSGTRQANNSTLQVAPIRWA